MSLQELNNHKLRSALSLMGIAFGIFCIIGVLSTVSSLENKMQSDVQKLGSNTIQISKWAFGGGDEYPWWKYVNRPVIKYDEVKFIKQRSALTKYAAYFTAKGTSVEYKKTQLNGVGIYGVSEDFAKIELFDMAYGRYFNNSEFIRNFPVAVIGYNNAEQLFGKAERAIGKEITFDGKRVAVIGVIAKQGQNFGPGFDYDYCVILPYNYYASIYNVYSNDMDPFIMVNANDNIPSGALQDELKGVMRQVRRLSPKQEDNFSLNDVRVFTELISGFFDQVNVGGWIIAFFSLLVGTFGVANIMFVTVRERTSQIGLKKAIGAKSRTILLEFLLESAFLCIIGGLLGLLFVWILTLVLSGVLPFPVSISGGIIILAFSICLIIGVLAGIIPASIAAKMNPVTAIRSV